MSTMPEQFGGGKAGEASPADGPIVEVAGISKRYGRTLALDNLSLDIKPNEMFALLGPNGAGKTTLIHVLCTILRPDSGTARICGYDILSKPRLARRHLGVVFQEPSLDSRLTVLENLNFHGLVYKVPAALRRKRIADMLELVELGDVGNKLVRSLSPGMKRRVEIARALVHDARVMILDEPTIGLDAQSRERIWDYLAKIRAERGLTVIVTTHYIDEVERCDRVCIIDSGKILALDTPDALRARYGREIVRLKPRDAEVAAAIRTRFPQAVTERNGDLQIIGEAESVMDTLLASFGTGISQMSFERPSLESSFLNLTGRELREERVRPRSASGTNEPAM